MKRWLSLLLLFLVFRSAVWAEEPAKPLQTPPLRRADIVFFLSFPPVLLSHVLVVGTVGLISSRNLASSSIPAEAWVFAGVSSLVVTLAITWFDYRRHYVAPTLRLEENESKAEARYGLSAGYRF